MLANDLKVLLGSTHVLYTKIHGFHWNIEGDNFPQYHQFLNQFYDEVYESLDTIAEYIRTLDSFAPSSLARFMELTVIKEQSLVPRAELMMNELLEDSQTMIELVKNIFDVATEDREQAIANYMADLQELYSKKAWMLRSILRTSRA
jgi:starvation-inducible DNA-binding protein